MPSERLQILRRAPWSRSGRLAALVPSPAGWEL